MGPAFIYNVPGRTGQDIPDSIIEHFKDHAYLLGVKVLQTIPACRQGCKASLHVDRGGGRLTTPTPLHKPQASVVFWAVN
jgi:hypothetical protein